MTTPANNRMDLALPAIRLLQQRAAELEARSFEPIAIVAMACRLPSGIETPEAYWDALVEGRDAIGAFPARWASLDLYDADPEATGKCYANEGGFVRDIEAFDPAFFGIAAREASAMDPQQRLVLETAWEALERAGRLPASLKNTKTGVYIGAMNADYVSSQRTDLALFDGYQATGSASSVISGRVSYVLGLQGPAVTVDTACSSSLVSLHLACTALRQGECDFALAGGVTVMSTPATFVEFSRLKVLAADGRCKSFSAKADGAGWSEGCGIVVLKRLSAAQRDGDRVLALIRGSAVNQDGRSQGLTAPNGPSQQRVIRDALAACRLTPADIDAVEAHGTGTALGDPIEAGALVEVFGPGRLADRPVHLGSSKSNFGHMQAAAGVSGVMKVVLALQHGLLPKTLHAEEPTPLIDWAKSGLSLLQQARPWQPKQGRPRRAGISSFGVSGTNAHVILEEAPAPAAAPASAEETSRALDAYPLLISARDEAGLRAQAGRWATWLRANPARPLFDVVYTAAEHRTHFESRASVSVRSTADAVEALDALAAGHSHRAVVQATAQKRAKVVFVFPGQGSQWSDMGKALLATCPEFAAVVAQCDAALRPWTGWSVAALLRGEETDDAPLDRIDVAQPILFTMYVGLAAAWRSLGVEPAAVVGHSQGEVAAAVVAGALTLEEGARVIAVRSRALRTVSGQGEMAVVELPVADVERLLARFDGAVSIAAVNTATSTAISGDPDMVAELLDQLDEQGVFCGNLNADVASHSAYMDPILPGIASELAVLRPKAAQVPFYSTVTGALLGGEALDGAYWCRNLREPVRLDLALAQMLAQGHGVFVEVSPHPLLAMPLTTGTSDSGGVVVGTLQREQGGLSPLLANLGTLHAYGHDVDWKRAFGRQADPVAELPTYAFQRQRYWQETPAERRDVRQLGLGSPDHPWLGAVTALADEQGHIWSGRLSLREHGWLGDHAAFGVVLAPGTGLLELALTAARAVGAPRVAELTVSEPLLLGSDAVRLQVMVNAPDGAGRRAISIWSQRESEDDVWTRHAVGELSVEGKASAESYELALPEDAETVSLDGFYERLRARGLEYGPAFRGLVELRRHGARAHARVALPEGVKASAGAYGMHPALLDAALHALAALSEGALLPFSWSDVELFATGATELEVRVELEPGADSARAKIVVADASGQPVLRAGELHLQRASAEQLQRSKSTGTRDLYRVEFHPVDEAPARREEPRRVVVEATGAREGHVGVAAQAAAVDALAKLQAMLADPELESAEIVWVTRHAVRATGTETLDLAHAPVWGLIRSARSETSDRVLRLLDAGTEPLDGDLVEQALSLSAEPELALRDGRILGARLVRVSGEAAWKGLDPEGAVLITGGTGELGQALAQHLVAAHGVRHLVLTSRRGAEAPGAAELVTALKERGADTVHVAACDVADRVQLANLLAGTERPWTAVMHLAGVLDDATVQGQNAERFERVMAPKVQGALHLDELTAGMDLRAFVLFSSASGTLGAAGQSNYAAANTFLDALAADRQRRGLAATSLAWGLWNPAGMGLTARLAQADLARFRRQGIAALSIDEGMHLLDAALSHDDAHLVPVKVDVTALQRGVASEESLPVLLRSIVRPRLRRAASGESKASGLGERLQAMPEGERLKWLVQLVQREAAVVLGLAGASSVQPQHVLKELGLDSLMAVELRRRLATETGVSLPATLAFDHPTPAAIATLLLTRASSSRGASPARPRARAKQDEPIAIVSMACRLPGGVENPEAYWDVLREGRDVIEEFPARWQALDVFDADPEAIGKSYTNRGGFVRRIDEFDAGFFGISAREAVAMDPQQRLILETAWEALERAKLVAEDLRESRTGVYIGSMGSDYGSNQRTAMDLFDGYQGTGSAASVISGRVAYVLGLQGPAVTVDTACSSSLVALHLACTALRQGECELALAGGVTVMSTPSLFVEFSRLKGLASDGRCKSFSATADGAGFSDGCGMVVLKRLSAAQRDGDRVLAVIRGSAVNQDGRSQGLTAPNGPAQQRVIRDALAASGLVAADIDAVEAHGTGTTLGDPMEAGALAEVFGPGRQGPPLHLGSAKSNMGHTQAAAGIAGVMKMVLALENELLPKTLHAEDPSPHVAWEASGLSLLREARDWKRGARVRRAGVSSFGISGTNAHVILEEAPALPHPNPPSALKVGRGKPRTSEGEGALVGVLSVSGRDEAALKAQIAKWAGWLREHPEQRMEDVAYTSWAHRTQFDVRAAVVARSVEEAAAALEEGRVLRGSSGGETKLAVLFTGQGSQRVGMGKGLYAAFPEFRRAYDEVITALETRIDEAQLDRTETTQPALFALEVALYRQWQAWGVEPSVLVGHSIGELSAAHVAGVLSLADAAKLVCARGRLMQACEAGGAMASVEATEAEVLAVLEGRVSIAGLNGPRQTVVSGDESAVAAIMDRFAAQGRRVRRLRVSHAFHSAHMDGMLEAFAKVAESCTYHAPKVTLVSTLTGAVEAMGNAAYWVKQVREAVRFVDAVATLHQQKITHYLECGPSGVLTAMATACLGDESRATLVPSLRGEQDEERDLVSALGSLHVSGLAVEVQKVYAGREVRRTDVPTYAFQRERYWQETPGARNDVRAVGLMSQEHPWLGAVTTLAEGQGHLLTGRISSREHAWLNDHAVFGTVLVPGTGLLELAHAAADAVGAQVVSELTLAEPMVLREKGSLRLQVTVGAADGEGRRAISIYSQDEEGPDPAAWRQHATGELHDEAPVPSTISAPWDLADAEPVDLESFYARLRAYGLEYGPAFQGLAELHRRGNVAYGRAVLPEALRTKAYDLHPALLDAALHALAALTETDLARTSPAQSVLLPFSWNDVELHATGASELRIRIELNTGADHATASVLVSDEDGQPVLRIGSLLLQSASAEQIQASQRTEPMYRVEFQPPVRASETDAYAPADETLVSAADVNAFLARLDAGERIPRSVIVDATEPSVPESSEHARLTLGQATLRSTLEALRTLQRLVADPRLESTMLTFVTREALDGADLEHAPIWGLVRAARSEHPERVLRLVDLGPDPSDRTHLDRALAVSNEPELTVRDGEILAPRLVRAPSQNVAEATRRFSPEGTVLLTGGTGELGRELARHLVVAHGVRHLVLTSRRGMEAPGAQALVDTLRESGAETVHIAACDVAQRDQVAALLARVERPWTGIVHLAGVLDDGTLQAQNADRFARVMGPKVDGAVHLHELTQGIDLDAFVLFSSASGTFGTAGQSNYAAANAFLDALAAHRRRQGRHAVSLAWGLWAPGGTGLTAGLSKSNLDRFRRQGIAALSMDEGLRLFDAALQRPEAHLVPLKLGATSGEPHPLLRSLSRRSRKRAGTSPAGESNLRERVLALPEDGRLKFLTNVVRREAAAVLGASGIEGVQPQHVLADLGLDSLMAVELRRRLSTEAGISLPATLAFDHPTPGGIAQLILERTMEAAPATTLTKAQLDAVAELLLGATPEQLETAGVASRLFDLQRALSNVVVPQRAPVVDLDTANTDDLLEFLDRKLGMAE
ncbi:SDR family NAD(P)-dependent oxidoreductase [Pendulispora rubella]|uniref:SDR family NAD(P)-dependent oxidoreductase n=1 Tax=Pendulispora rubella TaxID=2741070 RepID=A0ABZ2L7I6_9BACT